MQLRSRNLLNIWVNKLQRRFVMQMMTSKTSNEDSIFSAKKYIEYRPGKLNVIISIPHGGYLTPSSIPQRDAGCFIDGKCVYSHGAGPKDGTNCPVRFKRDNYTKELGFLITWELTRITQRQPHVVVNHLHRAKLDVNVELDKGTFGVPEAVDAWKAYHAFIEQAKQDIAGPGLLIDVHGQSHSEGWIELGYTLSCEQLNETSYQSQDTSVFSLATRQGFSTPKQIQQLIFGGNSFGGLLAAKGYTVVPSPSLPGPGKANYYPGGYTTQTHGSHHPSSSVDAIQLETPKHLRDKDGSPQYAHHVACTIHQYLKLYYSDSETTSG